MRTGRRRAARHAAPPPLPELPRCPARVRVMAPLCSTTHERGSATLPTRPGPDSRRPLRTSWSVHLLGGATASTGRPGAGPRGCACAAAALRRRADAAFRYARSRFLGPEVGLRFSMKARVPSTRPGRHRDLEEPAPWVRSTSSASAPPPWRGGGKRRRGRRPGDLHGPARTVLVDRVHEAHGERLMRVDPPPGSTSSIARCLPIVRVRRCVPPRGDDTEQDSGCRTRRSRSRDHVAPRRQLAAAPSA